MASGSRHLECPFHVLLTAHVGIVEVEAVLLFVEFLACVYKLWSGRGWVVEEVDDLFQVVHAIYFEVVHHGRLARILTRHDKSLEMLLSGKDGDGQGGAYGLELAVEAQFAHHHVAFQVVGLEVAVGGKDADGHGQVVAAAFLSDVGRREVHGDVRHGHLEPHMGQCHLYTVVTLTHGSVGHAREMEHHATADIHLDGDGGGFEPRYGGAKGFHQHRENVVWLLFAKLSKKTERRKVWADYYFSSSSSLSISSGVLRLLATTRR